MLIVQYVISYHIISYYIIYHIGLRQPAEHPADAQPRFRGGGRGPGVGRGARAPFRSLFVFLVCVDCFSRCMLFLAVFLSFVAEHACEMKHTRYAFGLIFTASCQSDRCGKMAPDPGSSEF